MTKNEVVFKEKYAEIILCNRQKEEVARALIDLEDVDRVCCERWAYESSRGYVYRTPFGNKKYIHRKILFAKKGEIVDHINHNRLDNRKQNIRIVTTQQNLMNRKCKGVYYHKTHKLWEARLMFKGKQYRKWCKTEKEALKHRINLEETYFKEYRCMV